MEMSPPVTPGAKLVGRTDTTGALLESWGTPEDRLSYGTSAGNSRSLAGTAGAASRSKKLVPFAEKMMDHADSRGQLLNDLIEVGVPILMRAEGGFE